MSLVSQVNRYRCLRAMRRVAAELSASAARYARTGVCGPCAGKDDLGQF
jgi:hypothetical protein